MLIGSDQKTGRLQDKQTASQEKQTHLLRKARCGTLGEVFPIISFLRNAKHSGRHHVSSPLSRRKYHALLNNTSKIKDSAPASGSGQLGSVYSSAQAYMYIHVCVYTHARTHTHTHMRARAPTYAFGNVMCQYFNAPEDSLWAGEYLHLAFRA